MFSLSANIYPLKKASKAGCDKQLPPFSASMSLTSFLSNCFNCESTEARGADARALTPRGGAFKFRGFRQTFP